MRLITWNCRIGGFKTKSQRIAALRPDVLAVQELSRPDRAAPRFAGDVQPTFRDHRENPPWPRSSGVFSYTDLSLQAVDTDDPMHEFRRYRAFDDSGLGFQIAAVWTAGTKDPATHYRQAIIGLRRYRDWIAAAPTIVLGDFNDNARNRTTNWPEVLAEVESLGLVSAYHAANNEPFGAETRPTFFPGVRSSRVWHIDYCFLPKAWSRRITSVTVGAYEEWRDLSDHVPLIVDVDL